MTRPESLPHSRQQARRLEDRVLYLSRQRRMKEAVAASRQLNRLYPDYAPGWYTSSQLFARLGKPGVALRAIQNSLRLEPAESRWQLQQAFCLMQSGQVDAARAIALQLDGQQLASAYQCASLGLLLSRLDESARALAHYRRAIELEPERGEHYYNLATVQRFLGEFDAAEQSLTRAIEKNPRDWEAYKLRTDLRQQSTERNHVEELEQLLEEHGDDPRAGTQLHYALAKELEDTGQWQRSFTHLRRGAAARRKLMRYDVKGDVDTMGRIAEVYDATRMGQAAQGCDNDEPIFIIGMPRTGSTLVERVLGSHSEIHSAGELNNFALEMVKAVARESAATDRKWSKLERVEQSAGIDFCALGEGYIASTRPGTGRTAHFTDKMPVNFLYAGLIHLALPRARIIHVRRHPLDTCYAVYKNLFADAYPFSYRLDELAHYYAAYHRLMAHWQQVMPGVIRDLYYEDLVRDLELACRGLLDYCDLEWQPQCLDYYRSDAVVTTASASQVRQPVYNSSVGRWRHFSTELRPLVALLESEGVEVPGL